MKHLYLSRKIILVIGFLFLIQACATTMSYKEKIKAVAEDYFHLYAQRTDFEKFMGFYAADAILNDIVYGNHLSGKAAIREFLNWNKGTFELLQGQQILTVTKQTIEGTQVVTEGYFHQFKYDDQTLGPWLFVISQTFNQHNLIVQQTDWINYTPREQFLGGKNMNQLLIAK